MGRALMARKSRNRNFEEMLDALRAHSFEVTPSKDVPSGMRVSFSAGFITAAEAEPSSL